MRWPGNIEAGRKLGSTAWSLDLFPTFCQLAGVELPEKDTQDGEDISGLILQNGHVPAEGREMYWETGTHTELDRKGWRAYRNDQFKYVHDPQEGDFLFDLSTDPNETKDLSQSDPDRLAKWKKRADYLAEQYRASAQTE